MNSDDLYALALKALVIRSGGSVTLSADELLDAGEELCRLRRSSEAVTIELVTGAPEGGALL